jgi:hypothetical protein
MDPCGKMTNEILSQFRVRFASCERADIHELRFARADGKMGTRLRPWNILFARWFIGNHL